MTQTKLNNGKIYRIPAGEIEYAGYFYGANGGREDLRDAYARIGDIRGRAPDFLINCELFDTKTRAAASDVVASGVVHRLGEGFGAAFFENRRVVFSYKNSVGAPDYVGFYPTLIRGGEDTASTVPPGLGGKRGRTALGMNDAGDVFLALVPDSGGATLKQVAKGLIAAGATEGGNLDGGGSSQWYSPGGVTYTGRALRGFIALWLRQYAMLRKTVRVKSALNIRRDPPNSLGVNLSPVVGVYRDGESVPTGKSPFRCWFV